MKGYKDKYKVRVGDCRLGLTIDKKNQTIICQKDLRIASIALTQNATLVSTSISTTKSFSVTARGEIWKGKR